MIFSEFSEISDRTILGTPLTPLHPVLFYKLFIRCLRASSGNALISIQFYIRYIVKKKDAGNSAIIPAGGDR